MSLPARLEHLHRLKHQHQARAQPLHQPAIQARSQTTRTANARTPEAGPSVGPAAVRMAASRPITIGSIIITAARLTRITIESVASASNRTIPALRIATGATLIANAWISSVRLVPHRLRSQTSNLAVAMETKAAWITTGLNTSVWADGALPLDGANGPVASRFNCTVGQPLGGQLRSLNDYAAFTVAPRR